MIKRHERQYSQPLGRKASSSSSRACVVSLSVVFIALMPLFSCVSSAETRLAEVQISTVQSSPPSTSSRHAISDALEGRVTKAFRYLETEMDRGTQGTVVYDDQDSGGVGFYPSGWMGDFKYLNLDTGSTENPKVGPTCLRVTYQPKADGWAGIYWSYPDRPGPDPIGGNWGQVPGRSLMGATKLTGWIRGAVGGETVELKIGGVNRPRYYDQDGKTQPHQDSLESVSQRLTLTQKWEEFTLKIPTEADLSSVIGGFACVFSSTRNPHGATIYLDAVRYDNADDKLLRLVRSYTPTADPKDKAIRTSFLYDNALVLLAFLARGTTVDRQRAQLLADTFVEAQQHDRFYQDGRWRNAYASGPLIDPATGKARLPGWYDPQKQTWIEDRYAVSSDSGNVAWAMIALLSAHTMLSPERNPSYLDAALRAGKWIEDYFRVNDSFGGYSGGFEGWEQNPQNPSAPEKLAWRSTEHNIDLFVAFSKLAIITGDGVWQERANHARKFVLGMWNSGEKFFWTGTSGQGDHPNKDVVPLDVQTWSILAMGHDPQFRRVIAWPGPPKIPTSLSWVEKACRLQTVPECPGVAGYKFSRESSGVWFEGTSQVAATYWYIDDRDRTESILAEITKANPGDGEMIRSVPGAQFSDPPAGIQAACPDPVPTGFFKKFTPDLPAEPWTYPRRLHIGATAWFVLSSLGVNPYWIEGTPEVRAEPKEPSVEDR